MFTKQLIGAAGATAQAKRAAIPSGLPNLSILVSGFLFDRVPQTSRLPCVQCYCKSMSGTTVHFVLPV